MEKQSSVTPQEMRNLDSFAINTLGIPGIVLMERAGIGVVSVIDQLLLKGIQKVHNNNKDGFWKCGLTQEKSLVGKKIIIVCGKGNNGGDGFVVARLLWLKGAEVSILLLAQSAAYKGDARTNLNILQKLNVSTSIWDEKNVNFNGVDVIVDAIFGTGFKGEVRNPYNKIIKEINNSHGNVVSIDIPSGLNGETGVVDSISVMADITVTMHAVKSGMVKNEGAKCCGEIVVVDIGIPGLYEVLGEFC